MISDSNKLREYSKEQSDIQEVVEKYRRYKEITEQLKEAKAMLEEKLMKIFAKWSMKKLMN